MSDNEREEGGGEEETPKNPDQITVVIRDQVRTFLGLCLRSVLLLSVCMYIYVVYSFYD